MYYPDDILHPMEGYLFLLTALTDFVSLLKLSLFSQILNRPQHAVGIALAPNVGECRFHAGLNSLDFEFWLIS